MFRKGCVLFVLVLVCFLTVPIQAGEAPQPLDHATLSQIQGTGCSEATGAMTGLAFSSGYLLAINPLVSASLLGMAAFVGAAIVVFC